MSMLKPRDREIKLFGMTITSLAAAVNHCDSSSLSSVHVVSDQSKVASSSSSSSCSPVTGPNMVLANNHEQDNSRFKGPCILSDLRAASEISSPTSSKTNGDQQSEITTTTSTSEDRPTTLERPDKILPCPRCESSNTKFCYYNNYNVSQPRHFCRNCQRYWTAGGSMRNVPVGSGRRKNKGWASSNHYLRVTSEDYENSHNNSGTILSFGSSESSVTETGKHQENKTHQGFLPPQVMLPNSSSPWPYQWSQTGPNTSFYPIPFYWGCTIPIWPTAETSPCLGKRSRDQTEGDTRDTTTTHRTSETTKNVVWPNLQTKPEKKTEGGLSLFNGIETKGSSRRSLVPDTSIKLQANPAAMSRSMNFRESMQQ